MTQGLVANPFDAASDEGCESGVLICPDCRAWYPVAAGVLDLLPEIHADVESRSRFFEENRIRMEGLGLSRPATVTPDPGFAAQEHQREHFDDLARREDRFSYEALGHQPFQRAVRSLNFEEWAPLIRRGGLALDVGCGDGISSFDLARYGVEVLALDISPEQIRQAADRAGREGIRNVSFMIGDANALPVADDAVDTVLAYGSLHHFPEPERTVEEIARVLGPGGCYIGVENNTTPLRPIFDALMRLRPIWLEEAGAHAQIGMDDLHRWSDGTDLRLSTRAIVFVPPHLCNLIGYRASRRLVQLIDWLFGRIPFLRRWGGLISIVGRR